MFFNVGRESQAKTVQMAWIIIIFSFILVFQIFSFLYSNSDTYHPSKMLTDRHFDWWRCSKLAWYVTTSSMWKNLDLRFIFTKNAYKLIHSCFFFFVCMISVYIVRPDNWPFACKSGLMKVTVDPLAADKICLSSKTSDGLCQDGCGYE